MHLGLTPHPSTPPAPPGFEIWANVDHSAAFGKTATLNIWWGIRAPIGRFVVPASQDPARRDELWKTTCFEIFLREEGGEGYREWNFAPSGDWAAYDFDAYRSGMREAEIDAAPYIRVEDNFTWWSVGATISVEAGKRWAIGVDAVIEERDGPKSYWALKHGDTKPDFHHADCFAAHLP